MRDAPPFVEFLSVLLPIINILVSLPLVLKLVPLNRWYGFRTRKTLSDESIWYEANYKGGMGLIVASVIALAARVVIMQSFERGTGAVLSMFVLMGCMAMALVVWGVQLKSM
ncbi:MAG TPA: SdpI family protein [Terriglobales bacterium]|nr:SdpI family protein [Terriglobales bacterium]